MGRCVAATGYAETTIADVVGEAAVSRRTFYEHFPNKSDCLIALYEAASHQALKVLRSAIDPTAPWQAQIELALRETDPARVQHSLAQLYVGADRLSHLVRQLLSLARNEPGAADAMRREPIDLGELLYEVGESLFSQFTARSISLAIEVQPDLPRAHLFDAGTGRRLTA